MASDRKAVPRATRDAVLGEYNHACAICGTANPQVHHIDGDHSNNDALNLLPLCPNCHLSDQHNPTKPLDPARVALFRRFKDPVILSAQFEPLFARLRFLDAADDDVADIKTLESSATELVDFVAALEMGQFYSKRLTELIGPDSHARFWTAGTPQSEFERWDREDLAKSVGKLTENRETVYELVVELLRYQAWHD